MPWLQNILPGGVAWRQTNAIDIQLSSSLMIQNFFPINPLLQNN